MFAPKLAALFAGFALALSLLSVVFGSAVFGSQSFSDWSLIAAQVCLWLAASVFLGYFLHGCAAEIRRQS